MLQNIELTKEVLLQFNGLKKQLYSLYTEVAGVNDKLDEISESFLEFYANDVVVLVVSVVYSSLLNPASKKKRPF